MNPTASGVAASVASRMRMRLPSGINSSRLYFSSSRASPAPRVARLIVDVTRAGPTPLRLIR